MCTQIPAESTAYTSICLFNVCMICVVCRVHIRRTDKLKQEASYHSVEEYMVQVSSNRISQGFLIAYGENYVYIGVRYIYYMSMLLVKSFAWGMLILGMCTGQVCVVS